MRFASKLALVAAVSAVTATVWAADMTWVGGQSDVWSNSLNWNPTTAAPTGSDYAYVPSAVSNNPAVYAATAVKYLDMQAGSHLTLQSGATLRISAQDRGALLGTITVTNGALNLDSGYPLSSGTPWTVGGILEFDTTGNFAGPTGTYNSTRTLINNGTIRSINSGIVYSVFSTISGGTLDGAWYGRTTIQNLYGNPLTLSGVTLGSSFSLVADSSHKAKTTLLDSVTNNSANVALPASDVGTVALGVSTGNSNFSFGGNGAVTLSGQSLGGTGVMTLTNGSSHTLRGYGTISPATVNNAGTIRATGGTVDAAKTLYATAIDNTGAIAVDQYNTLVVSGALTSEAGSTVTMNGGTLTASEVSMAGTLSGTGTVDSTVTLSGTIAPGTGTLILDGLTVADGAQYDFGPGALVQVDGPLTFLPGAQVTLNLSPGTAYGPYTLMAADSVSGTPRFMLDGLEVATFQEGDAIRAMVPEPAVLGVAGMVSVFALARRSRRPATI